MHEPMYCISVARENGAWGHACRYAPGSPNAARALQTMRQGWSAVKRLPRLDQAALAIAGGVLVPFSAPEATSRKVHHAFQLCTGPWQEQFCIPYIGGGEATGMAVKGVVSALQCSRELRCVALAAFGQCKWFRRFWPLAWRRPVAILDARALLLS